MEKLSHSLIEEYMFSKSWNDVHMPTNVCLECHHINDVMRESMTSQQLIINKLSMWVCVCMLCVCAVCVVWVCVCGEGRGKVCVYCVCNFNINNRISIQEKTPYSYQQFLNHFNSKNSCLYIHILCVILET